MKAHVRNTAFALLLSSLLAACGGGGSSGSSGGADGDNSAPPPQPPPPVVEDPGLRVSGTITASASQAVDSDTNDRASPGIPNDDLASAQALTNPITLGGYVNQPGTGASGRSQLAGDREDVYRVAMLAGQRITMLVADYRQADADLYLYNSDGELIDFSLATGEIESLVAPADGTYLVNASAFEGATNYILAIGTSTGPMATAPAEIVPWQTVVSYHDEAKGAASSSRLAMRLLGGSGGQVRLMSMEGSSSRALLTSRLGAAVDKFDAIRDPQLRARFETLMTIKRLRRDPAVAWAEPNFRVYSYFSPNDEAVPFQWHYPLIGLPEAWETSVGAPGVVVAVVDTGILSGHPDLRGQLVPGYDFVSDIRNAGDGDGIDPNPEDTGDLTAPGSSSYHGTHVAGTVAAAGDNAIGVAGVAYGARIMALRALGMDGSGTSYDVDQAIRYAAGLPNDSGRLPERPADIINLSLGGAPFSQMTQNLFNEVRRAGVMVVAAAGNEASTAPAYPASYDHVLSVSAVDIQRRLTSYSNSGSRIDVAAPGGNNSADINGDGYPDGVLSTGGGANGDFAYTFLSGTSMASPHVAGVLALMKSVNPALTPADVDALLESDALTDDLGQPGRDDSFGHGLVNAARAVAAALEASGAPPADNPRLSASATTLSFGIGNQPLTLDLGNAGKGELLLQEVLPSEPWLQVAPLTVDAFGLGQYQVSIDRNGVAPGVYAGAITARSSINTVTVRVLMSVGGSGESADVGTVYVLLYDPLADEVVAEAAVTSDNGDYRFLLEDVPPGSYELVAGSDADNDLFICDGGEACGAWLTLDQPLQLQLQEDREGLEFPIEYQVFIPDVSANGRSPGSAPRAPGAERVQPRHGQGGRSDGRVLH